MKKIFLLINLVLLSGLVLEAADVEKSKSKKNNDVFVEDIGLLKGAADHGGDPNEVTKRKRDRIVDNRINRINSYIHSVEFKGDITRLAIMLHPSYFEGESKKLVERMLAKGLKSKISRVKFKEADACETHHGEKMPLSSKLGDENFEICYSPKMLATLDMGTVSKRVLGSEIFHEMAHILLSVEDEESLENLASDIYDVVDRIDTLTIDTPKSDQVKHLVIHHVPEKAADDFYFFLDRIKDYPLGSIRNRKIRLKKYELLRDYDLWKISYQLRNPENKTCSLVKQVVGSSSIRMFSSADAYEELSDVLDESYIKEEEIFSGRHKGDFKYKLSISKRKAKKLKGNCYYDLVIRDSNQMNFKVLNKRPILINKKNRKVKIPVEEHFRFPIILFEGSLEQKMSMRGRR